MFRLFKIAYPWFKKKGCIFFQLTFSWLKTLIFKFPSLVYFPYNILIDVSHSLKNKLLLKTFSSCIT